MHTNNNDALRKIVNTHLGSKTDKVSKQSFETAKTELIFTKTALTKDIGHLTMEKFLELVEQKSPEGAGEKSAIDIVESYFIPLPSETINAAFSRAKKQSIAKLKGEVAQLKYFSFKDYGFKKKIKTSTKKTRSTNFDNVRVEKRRTT